MFKFLQCQMSYEKIVNHYQNLLSIFILIYYLFKSYILIHYLFKISFKDLSFQ